MDRGNRRVLSMIVNKAAFERGEAVRVPAGVIGQDWRDASRQALLSRSLNRCDEVTLDGSAARASGQLCGRTGKSDVIYASTAVAVLEATHRDFDVVLLTSDSRDMNVLLSALNIRARVIDV